MHMHRYVYIFIGVYTGRWHCTSVYRLLTALCGVCFSWQGTAMEGSQCGMLTGIHVTWHLVGTTVSRQILWSIYRAFLHLALHCAIMDMLVFYAAGRWELKCFQSYGFNFQRGRIPWEYGARLPA